MLLWERQRSAATTQPTVVVPTKVVEDVEVVEVIEGTSSPHLDILDILDNLCRSPPY